MAEERLAAAPTKDTAEKVRRDQGANDKGVGSSEDIVLMQYMQLTEFLYKILKMKERC